MTKKIAVRSQFVKNASYVSRLDDVAEYAKDLTALAFAKIESGDQSGADFNMEQAIAYLMEARERIAQSKARLAA